MMPKAINISDSDVDSFSSSIDSDIDYSTKTSLTAIDRSNNSNLFKSTLKSKIRLLEKYKTCSRLNVNFKNHTHVSFTNLMAKSFLATSLANCSALLNAFVLTFISCKVNN